MSNSPAKKDRPEEESALESNMSRLFAHAYEPELPPSGFVDHAIEQLVERAKDAAARRCGAPNKWYRRPLWRTLSGLAAMASLVILAGMAGGYWAELRMGELSSPPRAVQNPDEEDLVVATVASMVDATWRHPVDRSAKLSAGTLELLEGVAQLVFAKGAVVTLEGPAKLELIDPGNCRLLSGSVTANVPADAIGFTVLTSEMKIVDLGTAFGVRVDPDDALEVHVFDGEVNLFEDPKASNASTHLLGGQGIRLVKGSSVSIAAKPSKFVTREDLSKQLHDRREQAYEGWAAYSKQWNTDPSVVVRYDFQAVTDGAILNTVNADLHAAKPRNASPRLVNGRWPGKKAMLFDGRTDVLQVDDHRDLRLEGDFSLALWMKSNGQPYSGWTRIVGKGVGTQRNFGLWSPANQRLVWQLCPVGDFEWWDTELATRPLEQGKWRLLVGVLADDMAKIYVNGRLELARAMERPIATSADPMTIGFYDNVPAHEGHFCGELDELILLNRALSSKEIQAMYAIGVCP